MNNHEHAQGSAPDVNGTAGSGPFLTPSLRPLVDGRHEEQAGDGSQVRNIPLIGSPRKTGKGATAPLARALMARDRHGARVGYLASLYEVRLMTFARMNKHLFDGAFMRPHRFAITLDGTILNCQFHEATNPKNRVTVTFISELPQQYILATTDDTNENPKCCLMTVSDGLPF